LSLTPIQVAFTAKETIPVISAALDKTLRPKQVILIHTPDPPFRQRAQILRELLQENGIATRLVATPSAFDLPPLLDTLNHLVATYGTQLTLNATTGTHVMSTAALLSAQRHNLRVFYIRPDDRLIWLHPNESTTLEIEDRINLHHFLRARGITIRETEHTHWQAYQPFIRHLYHHRRTLIPQLIQTLRNNNSNNTSAPHLNPQLRWYLPTPEPHKLPHKNYLRGGWLEHYVYYAALQIKQSDPQLQDILGGAKLHSRLHNNHTEVDTLLLYNNRLYVIECKSLISTSNPANKIVNFVYKLDSLMDDLGGQITQGMLLTTLKHLPDRVNQRAHFNQIKLVGQNALVHIDRRLRQWLKPANSQDARNKAAK